MELICLFKLALVVDSILTLFFN